MSTTHDQSGNSAVLQSRVLNMIQALILAGIMWFGHTLLGLEEKVGDIQVSQAALAAHVDDVKFELEKANLQQMREDITMLKARESYSERFHASQRPLPQP